MYLVHLFASSIVFFTLLVVHTSEIMSFLDLPGQTQRIIESDHNEERFNFFQCVTLEDEKGWSDGVNNKKIENNIVAIPPNGSLSQNRRVTASRRSLTLIKLLTKCYLLCCYCSCYLPSSAFAAALTHNISPDNSFLNTTQSTLFAHHITDYSRNYSLATRRLAAEESYLGLVATFAGAAGTIGAIDGAGTNSQFRNPFGITISPDESLALVADADNHVIRLIPSGASVTTFAGMTGSSGSVNAIGTNAKLNVPRGVTFSPDGVYALVVDSFNNMIR
jgi:hypothetical protein